MTERQKELKEINQESLKKWYENQFEGGPIEPENLRNQYPGVYKKMMEEFEKKSPEDFNTANRGATQLQRPANENRDLQIRDPVMDAAITKSRNDLVKRHNMQRALDWNKAMQDKDAIVKPYADIYDDARAAGYNDTLEYAMKKSENGKTVILKGKFGLDFVYHDGRAITNPFK
jgi:hypothetical protein